MQDQIEEYPAFKQCKLKWIAKIIMEVVALMFYMIHTQREQILRSGKNTVPKCNPTGARKRTENSRKNCGNTDSSAARVPAAFLVLPNLHLCFYNSIETRKMFSIS